MCGRICMRLFAALGLPDFVSARLEAAVAPLRDQHPDVRWTRVESWHVTLAFIGDVADDAAPRAVDALRRGVHEAAVGPIALAVGAPGHFSRRALWYGVEDRADGAVARLAGSVRQQLLAAGLPCDNRPLHPHVTVARPRGRQRLPRDLVATAPSVTATWTAEDAVLHRSHLGRGGARYEALATIALESAAP